MRAETLGFTMNSVMSSASSSPPRHKFHKTTSHHNGTMLDATSQNPGSPALSTTSNGSGSSSRNEPPKRLRYWLIDMIDSGEIPGLQWEDNERTIFRIPWKHAGKNNWKEEDCKIFKAWAEHRGKYKKGDKVEAATWKTRLRCALNKLPDIKELKEKSYLEGNEPYRVYQLLPEPDKTQEYEIYPRKEWSHPSPSSTNGDSEYMYRPQSQNVRMHSPVTSSRNMLHENMSSSQMTFSQTNMDPSKAFKDLSVRDSAMTQQYAVVNNQLEITPPPGYYNGMSPSNLSGTHSPNERVFNPYPYQDLPNNTSNRISSPGGSDTGVIMDDGFGGNYDPVDMPDVTTRITPPMMTPEPHEMEIYIKYRGVTVIGHHVTEPSGCRVHYGDASLQLIAVATHELPSNVFGRETLDQIGLVDCEPYAASDKQVLLTKHVLNNIKRGLILSYDKDGCFYAKRLCQSRVFISGPESPDDIPEKLERNTKVKVFDYKKCLDKLRKFVPGGREKLPETELYASFGQNWSIKTPIDKNLVTLCMVPRLAKFLIHKVRETHDEGSINDNTIEESFGPDSYDILAERATLQSSRCVDELIRDISFNDFASQLTPMTRHQASGGMNNFGLQSSGYFQQNIIQPIAPPAMDDVEMTGFI